MLFHLPASGVDRRPCADLATVPLPAIVTIKVLILAHVPPRRRGGVYRIQAEANGIAVDIIYFRPVSPKLAERVQPGDRFWVSGRAERANTGVSIAHPDYLEPEARQHAVPEYDFAYPSTAGLGQRLLKSAANQALERTPQVDEWIDAGVMREQGWPGWNDALTSAHAPSSADEMSPEAPSRRRLAYDEVLAHQLTLALARRQRRRSPGRQTQGTGALQRAVTQALPYNLTGAQQRCLSEIQNDMARNDRMMRLLQGDVGSGKTFVAILAMLAAVEAGGQAAIMAPTEILARQHLASMEELLDPIGVQVGLLTGRDKTAVRTETLRGLSSGEIQIAVGTHALIQKGVSFADLRLVVVDEQHRFGVRERMRLAEKGAAADVLVMTATPIPRSLALTHFGDMDVSILDEKPAGRQEIQTAVVSLDRVDEVVERLRAAISMGQQAYWVCPLVEESEAVDLAAAEQRFQALRATLGEENVVLVHGRMAGPDKDAAVARFQANEAKVLVATTVIEVGVNVPNATIMVIERAENFGLSQLHQLRGRVGRGAKASTCVLLYRPPLGQAGETRLKTLRNTTDGFALAEVDLQMRGAGDVLGVAQSGLPRFQVADLEAQPGLMELARSDAEALLTVDPELTSRRGAAARMLLWLMRHEDAMQLIRVG